MSDKKFNIEIDAIGGDAAAAELTKPGEAASKTSEAVREINTEAGKFSETVEEVSDKVGNLNEGLEEIAKLQRMQVVAELGGQAAKLGEAFKNVADQVENFDTETAKTLRSTGDGLVTVGGAVSSIAVGFAVGGPLGAGVAALSEGVSLVTKALGDAAEEAVAFEGKAGKAFGAMVDKLGEVAVAKGKVELKNWLETLGAEEDAIRTQNDALVRNRQLIEDKFEAQGKLDAAKLKSELARIEADPNLSDADKIRKKAEATEAAEKKKVENQINAEARGLFADEDAAKSKDAAAQRAEADAKAVQQRKEAEDAELKELERRQKIKERAAAAIPAATAQAAADTEWAGLMRRNPFGAKARQEKAEASQEQLEELKNKAYSNPQEAIRLEELKANKAKLEAEADKTAKAAQDAREVAEKAKNDAAVKRQSLAGNLPLTVETYKEERDARATTSNAAVAAIEAKAAQEKADKENDAKDEAARKAAEAQLKARKEELASLAAANRAHVQNSTSDKSTSNIGEKADNQTKKLISGLGDDIGNADTAREIEAVRQKIETSQSELGTAVVGAMKAMLDKQLGIQRQIEILAGQIKSTRSKM